MVSPTEIQSLVDRRDALLGQLTAIGDLRPGTLHARYRRCGKPNCRCAREGDPGHGPKWVLISTVEGKTRNWTISERGLDATREQIAECRRLRRLTRELIAVSDELCQARLVDDLPERPAKRGLSRPRSRRGSTPKRSA